MIDWDWIISATILIVLGLGFWAKLSRQTIPELLASIKEALSDKGEDSVEYVEQVYD